MPSRLTDEERGEALRALPEWRLVEGREAIARSFRFASFSEAFAFMTRSALMAEKLDHHPEWSNVYDRVEVVLTTHDAGGLSSLDLRLAQAMDRIASQRQG